MPTNITPNIGSIISHAFAVVGVIVMGFGLLMLYGGFQNYRKHRLLKTSRVMPIRDVVGGLVHIVGKAVGENRLTSPLAWQPCFYYKVQVDNMPVNNQQTLCLRHTDHTQFYLQDASGKVRVDLHQAQLDITQTFRAEIGPKPLLGPPSANELSDHELWDYLVRTNAQIRSELANRGGEATIRAWASPEGNVSLLSEDIAALEGRMHLCFTETCILADSEYNILGTCLENTNPSGEDGRKLIARGSNKDAFVISNRAEAVLEARTKSGSYLLLILGSLVICLGLVLYHIDPRHFVDSLR
jgi:hypothetical protein